jgi:signal transduction histidine kinase
LNKALHQYPLFSNTQLKILHDITLPANDFQFHGDERLMVYVLINLIQYSLHQIEEAEKGTITISIEVTKNKNVLYFMDTGKNILPEMCDKIFDQEFSIKKMKTGRRLFFCREVMRAINGDITCHSQENGTQFTLTFPS